MDVTKRYSLKDAPFLLCSAPGRSILKKALNYKAWPYLQTLALYYRRLVIPKTRVIAVTGSFGKTTTVSMAAAILKGRILGERVNIASFLALGLMSVGPWCKYAIAEAGICKIRNNMALQGEMLRPDVAVVTCIGSEHNTTYKTLEEIRDEKAHLVNSLKANGVAILNGDDQHQSSLAASAPGQVITFGFGAHNHIRAEQLKMKWPHGTSFLLAAGDQRINTRVALFGPNPIYNALAAAAVAHNEGISLQRIASRLETLSPIEARMQPVMLPNGVWLLRDDFKSTEETIDSALDAFANIPAKRRWAVVGNISELQGKINASYRDLGFRVAKTASHILFIGRYFEKFKGGAKKSSHETGMLINCHHSILRAVSILQEKLRPGDVVLLKGRGSQHLGRIALALLGRKVKCDMHYCQASALFCKRCPLLATGLKGGRAQL